MRLLIEATGDFGSLNEFRTLAMEAWKIKSETLRKLIFITLTIYMIDFPLNFWQVNENVFKIATKVLGVIRDLMDEIKEMDGATKKFLSVFGNPEKRFELKKLELVGIINKNLGVIQLELGEEGAIESFERAYENLCQCRNYGNALNYLALKEGAKFCFHWSFGEMIDLKELKKMFGKYGFLCSLETNQRYMQCLQLLKP